MKHSTLRIYVGWLDTVRELLARHSADAVEAWQNRPALPELAAELRGIASALVEIAQELRDIADGLEHLEHRTIMAVGGVR